MASLNLKTSTLRFLRKNKECDPRKAEELIGRLIRFYYDENKKALAFREFENASGLESLANYHTVRKLSTKGEGYVVTVTYTDLKKIFDKTEFKDRRFSNLVFEQYKDRSAFSAGEVYYYTILN